MILFCAAFAYATAAVSPNMDIANAVLLTYPTALLFAAGFLLRWVDIPKYWIWCAPFYLYSTKCMNSFINTNQVMIKMCINSLAGSQRCPGYANLGKPVKIGLCPFLASL
jgi:glucan phosphoethanolaminetransferase (alkaline phosphatase superfamily)